LTALGQQGQLITFGTLTDRRADAPAFAVSATASSGLPVSFAASGSCTNRRNVIALTGAGVCTITASQAGDAAYTAAAPVAQSFQVTAAPDEPDDPTGPGEPHDPTGPVDGGVGLYLPSVVK
jgi:hypothetical protein